VGGVAIGRLGSVTGRSTAGESTVVEDSVSAVLGLWLVGGVYADGWAHLNVRGLDSFFTPWHGVLYGGFTALAVWLCVMAWRRRGAGGRWVYGFAVGYRLGAGGVLVFAAGGVADMLWHLAFGVEAGLDALVSPTHLVLLVGGMLLLTSPLRAVVHRNGGRLPVTVRAGWPALAAVAASVALAGFFLSYLSVFVDPWRGPAVDRDPGGRAGTP